MNEKIIGIIPLAGNASRMKNIPKFLLPCGEKISLLDNVVNIYNKNNIFDIRAGVSDTNNFILQNNNAFSKTLINTKTMAETVYKLANDDNFCKYILIMPDTFFKIDNEITKMKNMLDNYDIVVLLWNIKDYQIGKVGQCKIENNEIIDCIDKDPNCTYQYFWGSLGWNSNINKYINPEWETIGNLIKKGIDQKIKIGYVLCDSNYYDCGTYIEYFTMIKNEL